MLRKILIMNFGSTSTKVAVYDGMNEIVRESISHSSEELNKFDNVFQQKDFRKKCVLNFLERNKFNMENFICIASRGGTWKPVPSGIFEINESMIEDLKSEKWGVHPAGLGCIIALELAKEYGIKAITADSPASDEYIKYARFSGIKEIERISSLHVLNHKAIGRRYAESIGTSYKNLNLIIVHMGGGISVAAHKKGKLIDSNNALDGDGPFSPERSGSLPVGSLIKLCYSGKYTYQDMMNKVNGKGGLSSYLGTSNGLEIEDQIKSGNKKYELVYKAMGYQVAKEIGSMSTVLKGDVDAILFTGSLTYSDILTEFIFDRVSWISKIYKFPGEDEVLSLAENTNRYINREQEVLDYDLL